MTTRIPFRSVLLVTCGVLLGIAADRAGYVGAIVPTVAAQQGRAAAPPPTLESLAADVAQLKAIQPSNSHIMMDVQFHWTNLWFAAQKKDWEFAQYQFNEMRGHIIWLTRKSPTIRAQDGTDVDIKNIFDARRHQQPRRRESGDRKERQRAIRGHVQDHDRKLLLVPQGRGPAVSAADDSDCARADGHQPRSQRDVAAVDATG